MKYLKYFESKENDAKNLIKKLDSDYVDKYFKENYELNFKEIVTWVDIWQFVDSDRFVEDWINERVSGGKIKYDIDDEDNYRKYIEENLLNDEDVQQYLEKKRIKKGLEENSTYSEILEELNKKQLEKIIVDIANNEEECLRDYFENIYGDNSAYDILSELYSESDLKENGYKYVENYVDDDEIKDWFYDNEDYDYKCEWISEQIENDLDLQKKILEEDPKNSIELFDIIDEDRKNICGEYDFQKAYMDTTIENYTDEDGIYEDGVAKELKKLYDKFGLDSDIEEEYEEYSFYVKAEKFNI